MKTTDNEFRQAVTQIVTSERGTNWKFSDGSSVLPEGIKQLNSSNIGRCIKHVNKSLNKGLTLTALWNDREWTQQNFLKEWGCF